MRDLAESASAHDDPFVAFRAHRDGKLPCPDALVEALAAAALSPDPARAEAGTRALFAEVIEPLCDAFTPDGADAYRRLFARLITIARNRPECRALDEALRAGGIGNEAELLRRRPRGAPLGAAERARVRRVILLSRLTLGADVAICLPALRRLARLFPSATIHLIGGEGARVLARSVPRAVHAPIAYRRTGCLADRLNAWLAVRDAARRASAGLAESELLLVDPDSRLTQLGLLPPVVPERYVHFPSRSYGADGNAPLGELVCRWLDEALGTSGDADDGPLALPPDDAAWTRALRAGLGPRPIAAVSFGVGGNDRKRVGPAFEAQLLEWLARRGFRVLLARGAGAEEIARSERLAEALRERRIPVLHLPPGRTLEGLAASSAPIVTWEADVAAFFAAIAAADVYAGYDSAGQHIAAALGVPTLSVFVECSGAKHAARWRPCGAAPVRVVRTAVPADETRVLLRSCIELLGLADERGLTDSRAPAA